MNPLHAPAEQVVLVKVQSQGRYNTKTRRAEPGSPVYEALKDLPAGSTFNHEPYGLTYKKTN